MFINYTKRKNEGSVFPRNGKWIINSKFYEDDLFSIEWNMFPKIIGVEYGVSHTADSKYHLHIHIPFIMSMYLNWFGVQDFNCVDEDERVIGCELYLMDGDCIFTYNLWVNDVSWGNTGSKYRSGYYSMFDFIFGVPKFSNKFLNADEINIDMTEGSYPAVVTFSKCKWVRPRSFMRKEIVRAEVEMKYPIPFSGKGESSHDQGDDSMWSITYPVEDGQIFAWVAAEKIELDISNTRKRRGDESNFGLSSIKDDIVNDVYFEKMKFVNVCIEGIYIMKKEVKTIICDESNIGNQLQALLSDGWCIINTGKIESLESSYVKWWLHISRGVSDDVKIGKHGDSDIIDTKDTGSTENNGMGIFSDIISHCTFDELNYIALLKTLDRFGGRRRLSAESLNISQRKVYRLLNQIKDEEFDVEKCLSSIGERK